MRPTDLGFRSHKEITPTSYNPGVAFDGRKLSLTAQNSKFLRSRRFSQYDLDAKKLGFRVGPGSYDPDNLNIDRARVKNTHVYASTVRKNSMTRGHTMVGNLLVPDEEYFSKNKELSPKKLNKNRNSFIDRNKMNGFPIQNRCKKKLSFRRKIRSPYLTSFLKKKRSQD